MYMKESAGHKNGLKKEFNTYYLHVNEHLIAHKKQTMGELFGSFYKQIKLDFVAISYFL